MAFDKSRDYGVIMGDTLGRMYVQDGIYYGADGKPFDAAPAKRRAPKKADAPDDQLSAQLEE